jgi:hypothetical protein
VPAAQKNNLQQSSSGSSFQHSIVLINNLSLPDFSNNQNMKYILLFVTVLVFTFFIAAFKNDRRTRAAEPATSQLQNAQPGNNFSSAMCWVWAIENSGTIHQAYVVNYSK